MSLSSPKKTSPVSRYIEWKGGSGKFRYWDKEKESEVFIEGPIYIVVLDELSCITGFDVDKGKGIFSNEVHNLNEEQLVVGYMGGGSIANGLYKEIKGSFPAGAKYAKSVYAALIDPDSSELELVNFKLYGSSVGPWIEAKIGDEGNVIVLTCDPVQQTKGATKYYQPLVKKSKRREDILARCVDMDKDLQLYLYSPKPDSFKADYKQHNVYEEPALTPEPENTSVVEDDLPF